MPPIPPIPIHSNDPITPNAPSSDTTAAKPAGITPQTANPLPTRTTPASIPATTTTDPSAPPAPQPGARPPPPTAIAAPTGTRDGGSMPAPPAPAPAPGARPSTVTATHTTTETRALPAQFSIPPPVGSVAPGRSTTSYAPAPAHAGTTTLPLGPANPSLRETGAARSIAHPPGYAQDPYAADGSAAVRQSLEDAAVREHEGAQGGLWGLLGRAGEALRKGEEGVWRAVGGKGQ